MWILHWLLIFYFQQRNILQMRFKKVFMFFIPYESTVSNLMYLMVCTRSDITFVVGKVSSYMSNPSKMHWEAVKWIFRYFKGSTRHGLLFDVKTMNAKSLLSCVDVDHEENLDKKNLTNEFVFPLIGGCITWRSTFQKCISFSSI